MELERAKEVLKILADGIDPTTGEILPNTDIINNPEVIRALHVAVRAIDKELWFQKKRTSANTQNSNSGKSWTREEDMTLCQMFDSGSTKKEIRNHLKRTDRAIAARLVRLGVISSRSEYEKDLKY